jgi:hypothetical protein
MVEHHGAFRVFDVLAQSNAGLGVGQELHQHGAPPCPWLAAQISTVKLQKVECAQERSSARPGDRHRRRIGSSPACAPHWGGFSMIDFLCHVINKYGTDQHPAKKSASTTIVPISGEA